MTRRTGIAALLLVGLVGLASARPGGGHVDSGSGDHGSGFSDADILAVIELLSWTIRISIEIPQVVLPLLGIGVGFVLYSKWKQHENKGWVIRTWRQRNIRDWNSGLRPRLARAITLDPLRRIDADFSQVVFEDFVSRLFSTAHRSRHSDEALARAVGPYFTEHARSSLVTREFGVAVESVAVGALRVVEASIPAGFGDLTPQTHISVEVEANVTRAKETLFTVEVWKFARAANVQSRPPTAARTFDCPNCGAPWSPKAMGAQVCASCGETVDNGRFDWVVENITLHSTQLRPPPLTNELPERSTDAWTDRQLGVDARWMELQRSDGQLTDESFAARVALVYSQLKLAWTQNRLELVRGLVTDNLYDSLQYWIDAYSAQFLRNHVEAMRITHQVIAKVTRDKYYDAITVRIWGTGKDYVVREPGGELVRGSKHERTCSEYWTLIRSATRKGAPTTTAQCSNCGAPLDVTQSGECKHCNAHVSAGELDWVLSKIEQDNHYRG